MNKLQIHRVYHNMWEPFQEWTEGIKTMNILPIWSCLKFITLYYSIIPLEFLKDHETLIGRQQACVQTEASHFKGLLRRQTVANCWNAKLNDHNFETKSNRTRVHMDFLYCFSCPLLKWMSRVATHPVTSKSLVFQRDEFS